jgi:hypothetical protein
VLRAPFGVLVLPYAVDVDGALSYALLRFAAGRDRGWQPLLGEGARGQAPLEAAREAAWRVARVPRDAVFVALDSRATIEQTPQRCAVAEYAFGVRVAAAELCPSRAEFEHRWVSYEIADGLLHDEPDRNALFELRRRLGRPAAYC